MRTIRGEVTGRKRGAAAASSDESGAESGEDGDADEEDADEDWIEEEPEPPRRERDRPWPPLLAFSIKQFCIAHNLSESFFYTLQARGLAPRLMRVGGRKLISVEEARRWRAQYTERKTA